MSKTFKRPKSLTETPFHYCSGCTHGIIHRLIGEVIDGLEIEGETIGVGPVGCAVFNYKYFQFDMQQASHGRAPAVATGIKRVKPNNLVFTYQGDGDFGAIGIAEAVHAALRGENITVIVINNSIYGMTGGQMSPTTLIHQKTKTTPLGREELIQGYPLRISEMFATIDGASYISRCSVDNIRNINKTKNALKKAFTRQLNNKGFSLIEILSTCPVNWNLSPVESLEWLREKMIPEFPLGVKKEIKK